MAKERPPLALVEPLTAEERQFAEAYAAGPMQGVALRAYQLANADRRGDRTEEQWYEYASTRSTALLKRERVAAYIAQVEAASRERVVAERVDLEEAAQEAMAILVAANRGDIRLTATRLASLVYTVNRAWGQPSQRSEVITVDATKVARALSLFAQRIGSRQGRELAEVSSKEP